MQFANRTHLSLEPGDSDSFALDATGVQYTTPAGLQETLKDLARLQFLNGAFKFKLSTPDLPASGAATVQVLAGSTEIGSYSVAFDGSASYTGRFDIALFDVAATAKLSAVVTIDVAAPASATATLKGVLDIEHPLIVALG